MAKTYFEIINSWDGWGDPQHPGVGYLPEAYVKKGYVSNPYTLIDLPNETYVKLISIITNLIQRIKDFIRNYKK